MCFMQTVGHTDVSVTVLLSQLQDARRLLDEVCLSCCASLVVVLHHTTQHRTCLMLASLAHAKTVLSGCRYQVIRGTCGRTVRSAMAGQ
jgi:hypothetical protein